MMACFNLACQHAYILSICSDATSDGSTLEELTLQFREKGFADIYGDGDQSRVNGHLPTSPGQRLRDFWSASGDFYKIVARGGSAFMRHCFLGRAAQVKAAIDATEPGSEARMQLLELRESTLRFPPLMTCICGAKNVEIMGLTGGDYLLTADYLCAAGANVNCRDVAGYTPAHLTTTATGTARSLAIFRLIAYKYGADLNLPNRFGQPPLQEPIMRACEDNVEALLACGVKVGVGYSDVLCSVAMITIIVSVHVCVLD